MELKCAQNETIIKSWDYANTKQGQEHKVYNLTVTNKRLVSSAHSATSMQKREIYLDDVKNLECTYARNSMVGAIILFILAGIALIVAVAVKILPLLILTAIFVIIGIILLSQRSFTLSIACYGGESEGLSLGASSLSKIKKNSAKLKVQVNKEAAQEIIAELGAIILNEKQA